MPISTTTEAATTAISLNDITDVNVGTPGAGQDGQVVTWVNGSSEFQLAAGGGGGGGLTPSLVTASPLNATNGNLYIIDTATIGGPAIANLPALPNNGDQIAFCDGSGSDPNSPSGFGTNTLTINPDAAHDIQGYSSLMLDNENEAVWLAYDSTLLSWRIVTSSAPGGGGGGGTSTAMDHAEATRAATQSLSNGDSISWDTLVTDTNGITDIGGSNPTRFTIQETGRYVATGSAIIDLASHAGIKCGMSIYLNGTTDIALTEQRNTNNDPFLNCAYTGILTAGDYLELRITHDDGGTIDVTSFGAIRSRFGLTQIPATEGGGGGSALTVEDEGSPLSAAVTKINFVGAGVTATEPVANEIDVTIPGGGGSSSVDPPTGGEARITANVTVSNATWTLITWDTEVYDQETYVDVGGGNPERITVPETNWYILHTLLRWDPNATGDRSVWMRLNGNLVGDLVLSRSRASSLGGNNSYSTATDIAYMTANDYIETYGTQNSGGNLDVTGVTAGRESRIRVVKAGVASVTTGAEVNISSNQSIPNASWTAVTWDVEVLDQENYVDLGGNPTRITVPETGWYIVSTLTHWAGNTTGDRGVWIRVNGSAANTDGLIHLEPPTNVSAGHYINKSKNVYLTSGDYVELYVFQESGGNLNLNSTTDFETRMRIVKIAADSGSPSNITGGISTKDTTNTSVVDGVATAVSLETEVLDQENYVDIGGNPTRLTVPEDGWYVFSSFAHWDNNTTGDRFTWMRINGSSAELDGSLARIQATSGAFATYLTDSAPVFLSSGDYLEAYVQQNSGGNLNLIGTGAAGIETEISITKLLGEVTAGGGGSSTVGESAFVRRVTNQTIPNLSDTAMSFDTEDSDDANYWDIGQPTRFTIPATGVYLVEGHVRWTANASGRRTIKIFVNGVTTSGVGGLLRYLGFLGADNWQQVSTPMRLTGGDYVELFVDQSSGGNLDVIGNSNYGAYFSIVRLS